MPRRCALGCTPTRGVLHSFPNPAKFEEQFKSWVKVVSGKSECDFDYKKMKICDRHFTDADRNRNNRLNALAVPSLFLPGKVDVQINIPSITAETTPLAETVLTSLDTVSVGLIKSNEQQSAPGKAVQYEIIIPDVMEEATHHAAETVQPALDLMSTGPIESTKQQTAPDKVDVLCDTNIPDVTTETAHATETVQPALNPESKGPIESPKQQMTPGLAEVQYDIIIPDVTEEATHHAVETVQRPLDTVCLGLIVSNQQHTSPGKVDVLLDTNIPDVTTETAHAAETVQPALDPGSKGSIKSTKQHNAPDSKKKKLKKGPAATSNRIKMYMKKIKNLRREIFRLRLRGKSFKTRLAAAEQLYKKSEFEKITKQMTVASKIFTRMQYFQAKKKPKGRRFQTDEKVLSLSLYKRSPKCYALLSKYFCLPSPKSLKRLLAQVQLSSGINKIIFEQLKKTVDELRTEDRLCTLIFDEMSITPQIQYDLPKDELKGFANNESHKMDIANHALVFMVKGIRKHYKQPVAYYFTNSLTKEDLKKIVKEVITYVQGTGLIILCTVCDQSTVNVSTVNDLVGETKERYFRKDQEMRHTFFEVNKNKIIPLYDVPHLLKGIRNNLLTKNMTYEDHADNSKKEVKWEYFQLLYAADKASGELRCLQKLTEEHVDPDKIKKMRVKLAAQIFSHSVATTTDHLIARGKLPEKCKDIVPIVLLIDNLFDSLNSSSFKIPNGKIYKGPVKRGSPHHALWQNAIKCLKTMKFISYKETGNKIRVVETVVPSIKNFIKTIEGFQELWKILNQKYGYDAMLTRNFNQDPVENFFGNIRNCGARNVAPNSVAFEGAFKSLLLNTVDTRPHSVHANCEEDVNVYLQSLDFFLNEKKTLPISDVAEENESIPYRSDFLTNEDQDHGQRNYVCGWVLTKCLKNVIKNCKICKNDVIGEQESENNAFIKAKEYKNKKWLCYPSPAMEECFKQLQNVCVSHLKRNVSKTGLKKNIKMYANIFVDYTFKCNIHRKDLITCFEDSVINILIYSWCKSINRILAGQLSYHGEDEIKEAAQKYYNKHRHDKVKK